MDRMGLGEGELKVKYLLEILKDRDGFWRQPLMIFGLRYRRWNSKTIYRLYVQNVLTTTLCLRQACLGGYEQCQQVRDTSGEDETCFGFFFGLGCNGGPKLS